MNSVKVVKQINSQPAKVWQELSSFRGIEKYSPIASSTTMGVGKGSKRTCVMPDGAEINEILNFAKNDKMEMQYIITDGPFPVTDYVSNVKITQINAHKSEVSWDCNFNSSPEVAEEMKNLFSGFYNVIIDNLETYLAE